MGLASVQDGGRPGGRHEGVPQGGFADATAAALANALVGRLPGAPLLEFALATATLQITRETTVAFAGATASVTVDGKAVPFLRRLKLRAGAELRITGPYRGRYLYLALARLGSPGALPVWRRSVSPLRLGAEYYPPGSILQAGSRLPFEDTPSYAFQPGGAFSLLPAHPDVFEFTEAPETAWYADWISGSRFGVPRFSETLFFVDPSSDRTGVRLRHHLGARLLPVLPDRHLPRSSPTLPGTVQVLPKGDLIASLVDGPTMGGYPRVGHLGPTMRSALAQATGPIRLRLVS